MIWHNGWRWPSIRRSRTIELAAEDLKLGISRSLLTGDWEWPIYGVRHPPQNGTSGWYVWTGELDQQDDEFFVPVHERHFRASHPAISAYLVLPPGSGFVIAPGYEDVWHDESLLDL